MARLRLLCHCAKSRETSSNASATVLPAAYTNSGLGLKMAAMQKMLRWNLHMQLPWHVSHTRKLSITSWFFHKETHKGRNTFKFTSSNRFPYRSSASTPWGSRRAGGGFGFKIGPRQFVSADAEKASFPWCWESAWLDNVVCQQWCCESVKVRFVMVPCWQPVVKMLRKRQWLLLLWASSLCKIGWFVVKTHTNLCNRVSIW